MIINQTAGGGSGLNINGIVEKYLVAAGENISAGDFVTFIDEEISSTAALKTSSYTGYTIAAVALSETKVFIAHSYGSSYYLYGCVCTISGTTITAGTDTKLSTTTKTATSGRLSVAALGEDKVFIAYGNCSSNYILYGIVCTISGTTITAGTAKQLSTNTYSAYSVGSVVALSETKVFIAHSYSGDYHLYGIVCTISGTTITAGTDKVISENTHAAYYDATVLRLSETKVFIAHDVGGNTSTKYPYGIVCTISGTTITAGTDTKLGTTAYCKQIFAVMLNSSKVLVLHSRGSSLHLYGIVCTISGTTITAGTAKQLSTIANTGDNIGAAALSETEVFIAHSYGEEQFLYGTRITISGKTITVKETYEFDTNNSDASDAVNVVALDENGLIIFHRKNYTDASLNYITRFINQVKGCTGTIDGVAKTSGAEGKKIDVYRPE